MSQSILQEKSFQYAIRIIRLFQSLKTRGCDITLRRQVLRSGTSIGANIREARNAESKADFAYKLGIAQKEAGETAYWIELLHHGEYLSETEVQSLLADLDEIMRMIRSSILTTRGKIK